LTFSVNRDILREAVFLCKTPLPQALSIAGIALANAAFEDAASFASTAFRTDFIFVFTLDFRETLRPRRFSP
jgi:hypothetical protein